MNTKEIYNDFNFIKTKPMMRKITIVTLVLLNFGLHAQGEQPVGSSDMPQGASVVPIPAGCGFNPSSSFFLLNCKVVWFCYDESGNRVIRFVPICSNNKGWSGLRPWCLNKFARDSSKNMSIIETTLIYPNPTQGATNIEFDRIIENGKVDLFDMEGRSISSHIFTGKKTKVDLSQQAAGTYYIIISSDKEKVTKPVIKE